MKSRPARLRSSRASSSKRAASAELLRLAWIALMALPFAGFQLLQSRELPRELKPQISFPVAFLVNSTGDGHDAVPDGTCETAAGNNVCTLRAAIEEVNAGPSTQDYAIIFGIPTSDPNFNGIFWTIPLGSELQALIHKNIEIDGPGVDKLTVQRSTAGGTPAFRIFNVTTAGTKSFSGMTISNGNPGADDGGGIQNAGTGTVNVTSCTLSNNFALDGGGISNSSTGQVHVSNSTLSSNFAFNTASRSGGGILNKSSGTVDITNSTLSGNSASGLMNGSSNGGGISNNGSGTVNVTNSTLSGNDASGGDNSNNSGGCIYNNGTLTVTNSTFSRNSVRGGHFSSNSGGCIVNNGTLTVTNCTLSSNLAVSSPSTFSNSSGGGIAGTANVKSSIIALNGAASFPDVSGGFTSAGFNLIGKTDGSTGFTAATDQTGTIASPLGPKLDPSGLQNNGGPTQTIALLSGSPAIDKGTSVGSTGTLTNDQRGVGYSRTVDDPSVPNATGGDGTDVGAFEFGARILAGSRKTHGSTDVHDMDLPLIGATIGVECRRNTSADTTGPNAGRDHEVVFTFPTPVTVGGVSVTSNNTADTPTATSSVSSNIVTVDLHNIPNARTLTVNLSGVSDGTNTNNVSVPMGVLWGDVNGDGFVLSGDYTAVRQKSGAALDNNTFKFDINCDGFILSGDYTTVRQLSGSHL